MLPQVQEYLLEDDNVSAWMTSNRINSIAPFFSTISKDDDISAVAILESNKMELISLGKHMVQVRNGIILANSLEPVRLPREFFNLLEKEGLESVIFLQITQV